MFAKFSYLIRTHAISSPLSQILRRTGTICLRNIGTRSNPRDVLCFVFSLPLPNNTVQTFSGAKGSSLSRLVEQCLNGYFEV